MFNLGMSEILIIVVVLLLVLKPQDVPAITRKIGAVLGGFNKLRADLMKEVRDIQRIPSLEEPKKTEDNSGAATSGATIKQEDVSTSSAIPKSGQE